MYECPWRMESWLNWETIHYTNHKHHTKKNNVLWAYVHNFLDPIHYECNHCSNTSDSCKSSLILVMTVVCKLFCMLQLWQQTQSWSCTIPDIAITVHGFKLLCWFFSNNDISYYISVSFSYTFSLASTLHSLTPLTLNESKNKAGWNQ